MHIPSVDRTLRAQRVLVRPRRLRCYNRRTKIRLTSFLLTGLDTILEHLI